MKYIILIFSFLTSLLSNAQLDNEGEIIISRGELISILETIKKESTNDNSIGFQEKKEVFGLNLKSDENLQLYIIELQKSLKLLHKKIDTMQLQNLNPIEIADRYRFEDAEIEEIEENTKEDVKDKKNKTDKAPIKKQGVNTEDLNRLSRKIDLLMAQQLVMQTAILAISSKNSPTKNDTLNNNKVIDPSLNIVPTDAKDVSKLEMNQIVSNPIDTTTNQLKVIKPDLQQPKKNAKIPKKTSVTLNSEVEISEKSNYELLKEKFKNYNATIYFENNSTDITDEITVKTLDSMIAILNQNNQIDIYLQGFASNTGSKTYNDKISLRRTLQIKNHLIRNGIAPERILSFNPGIDTNAKTPAEARRVSVSLLIRK